jgi:hypothetical protein
MKKRLFAGLAAALLMQMPLAIAAGTDDLLEVTTKIEMPGMTMPAQTVQVCSPKGKTNESMVPQDSDCKMTESKRSGNKSTFKMVCNSPQQMTGTGEFVTDGPNAYHGKMHMTGKVDGETMDMTTTYSSKRIGSCTYEDLGKKAKEQNDIATAAACRERMDAMEWEIYFGEHPVEFCKPYRKEFCGRVSKRSDMMRDPANYADPKNKKWKEAAEACGQNTEAVLKEACGRAPGADNWQFVADNCPAEAKQAAAQYCEGRSYTARFAPPYGPVCQKYASEPGAETARMGNAGMPSVDSIKKDGAGAALEKGAKALKGLLNF